MPADFTRSNASCVASPSGGRGNAAEERFQVPGFRDGRMDGMIGRLTAGLQNLYELARMPGRRLNGGHEVVGRKVVGAGAGDEQSVSLHETQCQLVQLAVRRLSLRNVLLTLDERRRINDDDIKALTPIL